MGKDKLLVIGGILGTLALIIGGALVLNQQKFGGDPSKLLTKGRGVHWHANFSANVCGKEVDWTQYRSGAAMPPIHTHADAKAHMEAAFKTKEDIIVRKFFQYSNIPFSEKGIFDKVDGSPCTNPASQATDSAIASSGRLKAYVNDQEVQNILDYPMHDPDKPAEQEDKIRLVYE